MAARRTRKPVAPAPMPPAARPFVAPGVQLPQSERMTRLEERTARIEERISKLVDAVRGLRADTLRRGRRARVLVEDGEEE